MLEKIINYTSRVIAAGAILAMSVACTPRYEILGELPSDISFSNPVVVPMAQDSEGAEKRKFADFNGDGIEDMGEVNDEKFFGQDYRMRIFPGYYNEENYLTFGSQSAELQLPLKKGFNVSAVKIDSGDVNGDGWADIIFTSFVQGWKEDEYNVEIALNDKHGSIDYITADVSDISEFSEGYEVNEQVRLSLALMFLMEDNYAMYGVYSSDCIDDYLTLDWADSNGDGKDDLYVFWRSSGSDLIVTVFPVEEVDSNSMYFGKPRTDIIESFMYNRYMGNLDTEDYDGDGIADLCIYHPDGKKLKLSVALGSNEDDQRSFQPQEEVVVLDTDLKFWTTLEKYDSFDGNRDGRADVVHIGILDGVKVLSYNLSE